MKKYMMLLILAFALLLPSAAWAALPEIPPYSGEAVVELNHNVPGFTPEEMTTQDYISYSELDEFGRCGPVMACLSRNALPTALRGEIAGALPTGWVEARYDDVIDGYYLYSRCHLLSYDLGGKNDDGRNFLTGTRALNARGLQPYEEKIADYLLRTSNHVLYRVTPVFEGANLLAKGVQLEAISVEDSGKTVSFNVFAYNVQPGVIIDYATGESERDPSYISPAQAAAAAAAAEEAAQAASGPASAEGTPPPAVTRRPLISLESLENLGKEHQDIPPGTTYVFDNKTFTFHATTCPYVDDIYNMNKEFFTGTRDEAIIRGYSPCSRCSP